MILQHSKIFILPGACCIRAHRSLARLFSACAPGQRQCCPPRPAEGQWRDRHAQCLVTHEVFSRQGGIFCIFSFSQQLTFFYQDQKNTQGTTMPRYCAKSVSLDFKCKYEVFAVQMLVSWEKGRSVSA